MDGKKVKNPIGSFGLSLHHHTITSFLWQWAIHFREREKKKSKFFFQVYLCGFHRYTHLIHFVDILTFCEGVFRACFVALAACKPC